MRGARHADGEGAGRSIPSSKPGVLFLFRTTLGTGLARTGTNTGTSSREPPCKILFRGKNRHVPSWTSTSLVKFFSSDLVTKVEKVPVSGEDRREISKDRRREDSEPKIKLILLVAVRGAPVPEINAKKAFLLFAERLAPTHKQQRCVASCACGRGETHRRRGGGAIYSQL